MQRTHFLLLNVDHESFGDHGVGTQAEASETQDRQVKAETSKTQDRQVKLRL